MISRSFAFWKTGKPLDGAEFGPGAIASAHRREGRIELELLALLKHHEEAARQRVEELRAELAALNERIAAAEGSCPIWWSLRRRRPVCAPNATWMNWSSSLTGSGAHD